ncbi:MAG: LTA synthase family protein [Ruminococcus sp.]|nr:LTA synthase family protein [Ruminococcus sp.]
MSLKETAKKYIGSFGMLCFLAFAAAVSTGLCGECIVKWKRPIYKVFLTIGLAVSVTLLVLLVKAAVKKYRAMEKPIACNTLLFSGAAALWAFTVTELCVRSTPFKTFPPYIIMGFVLYWVPFLLGAAIFKRPKVWFIVWEALFALYGIIQHYIIEFRGSPVKFSDLYNISSAISIKDDYSLTFSPAVLMAALLTAALIFLTVKLKLENEKVKQRLITLGAGACAAAAVIAVTEFTYSWGLKNRVISLNLSAHSDMVSSKNVGNLLMFYYDGVFNRVKVPEDYSTEKAEEILDRYTQAAAPGTTPIIIGVLNESFADYSHIAPFKTNTDYLSCWHSLEENTIKGYVSVSAYGGYTCNSEYEFLTGNTMQFLPQGSAAFTNYLNSSQDSLVSQLNGLGFDTVTVTPWWRTLWKIEDAYGYLGFKDALYEDTIGLEDAPRYNTRISDKAFLEKVEEVVENRDKSKGLFVWATTMQNHSPYTERVEGGIELQDHYDEAAEIYLNLISLSDKAVGELIDRYRDYDEQVVIVMFGDHYPHIPDFSEDLFGGSTAMLDVEKYSRIQQTPFLIWSNRDIEEKWIDDISLNYLANETLKAAGLPLSPVQQELEHIRESIPIISGYGFKTADGKWHRSGEYDIAEKGIIEEYRIMQYYRMFDEKRRR